MKVTIASIMCIMLAISLCGCRKSPKGFYFLQNALPSSCYCMEFKDGGKVILRLRRFPFQPESVEETTFTVEKGVVTIHEFIVGGTALEGRLRAIQFKMQGDLLVANAFGLRYKKDTSG